MDCLIQNLNGELDHLENRFIDIQTNERLRKLYYQKQDYTLSALSSKSTIFYEWLFSNNKIKKLIKAIIKGREESNKLSRIDMDNYLMSVKNEIRKIINSQERKMNIQYSISFKSISKNGEYLILNLEDFFLNMFKYNPNETITYIKYKRQILIDKLISLRNNKLDNFYLLTKDMSLYGKVNNMFKNYDSKYKIKNKSLKEDSIKLLYMRTRNSSFKNSKLNMGSITSRNKNNILEFKNSSFNDMTFYKNQINKKEVNIKKLNLTNIYNIKNNYEDCIINKHTQTSKIRSTIENYTISDTINTIETTNSYQINNLKLNTIKTRNKIGFLKEKELSAFRKMKIQFLKMKNQQLRKNILKLSLNRLSSK